MLGGNTRATSFQKYFKPQAAQAARPCSFQLLDSLAQIHCVLVQGPSSWAEARIERSDIPPYTDLLAFRKNPWRSFRRNSAWSCAQHRRLKHAVHRSKETSNMSLLTKVARSWHLSRAHLASFRWLVSNVICVFAQNMKAGLLDGATCRCQQHLGLSLAMCFSGCFRANCCVNRLWPKAWKQGHQFPWCFICLSQKTMAVVSKAGKVVCRKVNSTPYGVASMDSSVWCYEWMSILQHMAFASKEGMAEMSPIMTTIQFS